MRCPACFGELAQGDDACVCTLCGTEYPVLDGVPVLLSRELSAQHAHQREYFDSEFSGFERYRLEPWRQSFNRRIFTALDLPGGGPYLDVGVGGSGGTVIEAARLGVDAVGCDLSVEGVVHAARFAVSEEVANRTSFVVCAAERLPFADESFGAVSAVAVLEHLDDDAEAAAELARVLWPGGRLWVTVPHAYRYIPSPVWPIYWLHDRRIGHKRHYDERRLRALLEQTGLRHLETQFTGHPVKLLQYGLSLAGGGSEERWWALERRDLRAIRRPLGALQLSAVFEKP